MAATVIQIESVQLDSAARSKTTNMLYSAAAAALFAGVVWLAMTTGAVNMIARAAGNPTGTGGEFANIIKAVKSLLTPLLLVMLAATPLAVIAGLGMSQMGNRKGFAIAGGAVVALVIAGSASAIVA